MKGQERVGDRKVICTGNPVRRAIAELPAPEERFAQRNGALRLLVLGGSLGARALNEIVPAAIAQLPFRAEIWHQAGSRHLNDARARYRDADVPARVEPFIHDMASAYGWADLVVCRAGALTIAELAAAGVGAVLVPYPHAVDDHQTRNAAYLADGGAALVVQQDDLTPEKLRELLVSVGGGAASTPHSDPDSSPRIGSPHPGPLPGGEGDFEKRFGLPDRARLLAMARAARRLAKPQAAELVAQQCWEAARG